MNTSYKLILGFLGSPVNGTEVSLRPFQNPSPGGIRVQMGIMVRLRNRKAILRLGAWVCADPSVERLLSDATEAWMKETGGPALSDPDPERTVAEAMMRRLGGNITHHVPAGRDTDRIYVGKRQLTFDF